MKRDMDLCRKILLKIEAWPTTLAPKPVQVEGYTQEQVGYHAWMLAEEGLIEGADTTGMGQAVHSFLPRCLTYEGHDFLEDARNDTRWKRAKDALAKLGGPMTVAAFRTVLQQITATDISKLGGS